MKRSSLRQASLLAIFAAVACLLAITGSSAHAEDAQWYGRFWNNKNFSGNPVLQRWDNTIDFDWGGGAPDPKVGDDNFSAIWTRRVGFQSGTYRFTATMDDAMRVYLDNNLIIDSWTDSQEHTMTKDTYISGGEHDLRVEYYEAGGMAVAKFSWQLIHPEGESTGSGGSTFFPNWKAEYFNNTTLSGAPALVRDDRYLNHDWGTGSPAPGVIGNDNFSARWTKTLNGNPGTYNVVLTSDDGARLYVNNQLLIDNWRVQAATTKTANFNYTGGPIQVRVEYFEQTGGAEVEIHLSQTSSGQTPGLPGGSTSTASCGPLAGSVAYVNTPLLNFRDGPAVQFPIITTLPQCSMVELTGYRNPLDSNAGDWVQVLLFPSGQLAWAAADYLTTGMNVDGLTVLTD